MPEREAPSKWKVRRFQVLFKSMVLRQLQKRLRLLPLQAKMTSVILVVLLSVFALIPVSIHYFVKPLLLDEMRRIGVSTGSTLVDEITDQRLLSAIKPEESIESRMRELLYLQPNVRRIEVFRYDSDSHANVLVATSVEEDEPVPPREIPAVNETRAELLTNAEEKDTGWEILIPVRTRAIKRPVGVVRVVVSVELVSRMVNLLTRVSMGAAFLGVLLLTSLLSFALRRTIENDRKLREAKSENRVLAQQLQETEKRVMNLEKLAVMGQLTANFAHEIGTPLNAIGGHLVLLKEEATGAADERIRVIEGQVNKITEIVRGFLQSTAKPASQHQLVDPHRVMETTLQIVKPRIDLMQVRTRRNFDRDLGPIRMVPIELEQVLLNLVTNSLDSMKEKAERDTKYRPELEVTTSVTETEGKPMLEIVVRDNGVGIEEKHLKDVVKPFYTTKAPGEGTGLGLSICKDILKRYRGTLDFKSHAGEWTEAQIRIPFRDPKQKSQEMKNG